MTSTDLRSLSVTFYGERFDVHKDGQLIQEVPVTDDETNWANAIKSTAQVEPIVKIVGESKVDRYGSIDLTDLRYDPPLPGTFWAKISEHVEMVENGSITFSSPQQTQDNLDGASTVSLIDIIPNKGPFPQSITYDFREVDTINVEQQMKPVLTAFEQRGVGDSSLTVKVQDVYRPPLKVMTEKKSVLHRFPHKRISKVEEFLWNGNFWPVEVVTELVYVGEYTNEKGNVLTVKIYAPFGKHEQIVLPR